MQKVKKILVPVDFSQASASRLKYATALAREMSAEVFVLYVLDRSERNRFLETLAVFEGWPVLPKRPVPVDICLREKSLDLYNFIQTVIPSPGTLRISKRVRLGSLVREILAVAKKEAIDFIVAEVPKYHVFSHVFPRRAVVRLLCKMAYPVLLTPVRPADSSTPRGPLRVFPAFKPPHWP